MLVNGDFNVNQRGQSSYTGEGYGLDMWKIRTSGTMTINSGYVLFVGNSFAQFIPVSNFETSDYTVVIKLLNEDARVYHFNSFTGDYVEITLPNDTKVKCSLQYVNSKYIMLTVWTLTGSAVNIEYIDMFKGAIAFDHRREDYATALMRCERYLEVGQYACYGHREYWIQGFTYRAQKADVPTVKITFVADSNGLVQKSFQAVSPNIYDCPFIRLTSGTAASVTGALNVAAQISCEP